MSKRTNSGAVRKVAATSSAQLSSNETTLFASSNHQTLIAGLGSSMDGNAGPAEQLNPTQQ